MRISFPLFLAGLAGFSGVVLGAFGAHALKPQLDAAKTADIWHTAVLYHLIHAVALWGAAIASRVEISSGKWLAWAVAGWALGIVLFSGSLYALAFNGPRWLGPITPLGGAFLLLGWAAAIAGSLDRNPKKRTSTA